MTTRPLADLDAKPVPNTKHGNFKEVTTVSEVPPPPE